MSKKSQAGYEIARIELEAAAPGKNRKDTEKACKKALVEFCLDDEIWEGIFDAMMDYEQGNEWKF